jgi:hypothetical protein
MKSPKNKFIVTIITLVVTLLWYVTLNTIFNSSVDRSSYVVLLDWKATLNNSTLEFEKKTMLVVGDKIETLWKQSLAMVKWWDWSITRVGWDSILLIKESNIDEDLLSIKIGFELKKWKTWSNVISFIWADSHFHQTFADTTAAVSGTIFEVNLEKDYLYVESHEVKLIKDSWETKIISEKSPFIISEFSFINLVKFIKKFKDSTFRNLNIKLDKELYNDLVRKVWDINKFTYEKIGNIYDLTEYKKQELYNELLKQYQKINFVSTSDLENYSKKLEIKKSLIELSSDKNKKNLLITTLYDFKDFVSNKEMEQLVETFYILSNNKNYLEKLDINLWNYISIDSLNNIKIPDTLKNEFKKSINNVKDILNLESTDLINSAKKSISGIKNSLGELWDKITK